MTDRSTARSRFPLVAGIVVAAVAAVVAVVWYVGGDEPEEIDSAAAREQADAVSSVDDTEAAGSDDEGDDAGPGDESDTDDADDADDADGADGEDPDDGTAAGEPAAGTTYVVDTEVVEYSFDDGSGSFVGFRIEEELSNVGQTEAVGRTPEVEGSVTVDGATVTDATFIGDARALTTDRSQRDRRARAALGDGILRFELTEPIELPSEPAPGDTATVEATGDLTVNGVTRAYTVPLEASISDAGVLVVTSSFPVTLSDHEIEAPSAPIVLSVSDVATVEVQLFLTAP